MCRLKYPTAPCLNVGSPQRPSYLPLEVCSIAPGQRRLKLDERQTAEMIKTAAKKPHERAAFIEKAVNEQAQFPNDPVAKAFGLKINPKMMEVNLQWSVSLEELSVWYVAWWMLAQFIPNQFCRQRRFFCHMTWERIVSINEVPYRIKHYSYNSQLYQLSKKETCLFCHFDCLYLKSVKELQLKFSSFCKESHSCH